MKTQLTDYLQRLQDSQQHYLVLVRATWSGHAELYEGMLKEIAQDFEPIPKVICLDSTQFQGREYSPTPRGSPLLFHLYGGEIKRIITGIPTRFHLKRRLSFTF